jgi:hypothetical protein
MAVDDDLEGEDAALWRRTVETLLERGASPAEAIEGANLVLQSYLRHRQATQAAKPPPEEEPTDDGRGTGMRRRRAR